MDWWNDFSCSFDYEIEFYHSGWLVYSYFGGRERYYLAHDLEWKHHNCCTLVEITWNTEESAKKAVKNKLICVDIEL